MTNTGRLGGGKAAWWGLALILALTAAARLLAIDAPLERDEGEYAYAGQLLLQGVPPYAAAYNMKFPGTYGAYAAILAAFGASIRGIHAGLLVVNAAAIVLLFVVARRLFGTAAGLAAAASYALLSTGHSVLGMAAHATHFVVAPALLGAWLVLDPPGGRAGHWRLLAAGVAFGVAALMKQHGAMLALFGLVWILGKAFRAGRARGAVSRAAVYTVGVAAPLGLTAVALAAAGVFGRFRFWTIEYARAYVGERPLHEAWTHFSREFAPVAGAAPLLWAMAALGLAAIWTRRENRERAWFLTLLLATSFLSVMPGLWFRQHYFVLLLPAAALLIGAFGSELGRLLAERRAPALVQATLPALLFGLGLGQSLASQPELLTRRSPEEISRANYGANPFPEAVEIARYIAERTRPDERIAVLGSEPEIYFYARRRSATGYIYTYALMEPQPYARRMQEEMIREIETARPRYLVFVQIRASWLAGADSEQRILDWYRTYAGENYEMAGIVDILPAGTVYRWDDDVAGYTATSDQVVYVYRAKTAAR